MSGRQRAGAIFFLCAILILGFALRLFRLDYQSIWWDEGISLHLATSPPGEILADRLDNIHPPLYFLILKVWLALTGVSAFSGRYLSALSSLLQVALVFTVTRSWGGWGRAPGRDYTPWIAAALMVVSPLSVIYGQEIRVYAMLPLAYMVMIWLGERLLSSERADTRLLIYLGIVEWLGLHLHYIAIFGVAYVGLWGAVVLSRRKDWPSLRRWIAVHLLVGLASLPWFLAVLVNWQAIRNEATAGTFTTEPVPIPFLIAQVWAFHLTGLAGSLGYQFVRISAGLAAVLALLLLGGRVLERPVVGHRLAHPGRMAAHWAGPLVLALLLWNVRSFSHPRYVVMFAALLIPLLATLLYATGNARRRVGSVGLALVLVALSLWGLRQYFFDAGAAKPDMRGVAAYLEEIAVGGDLIVIPDTDWSFPYEYNGPATVLMPGFDQTVGQNTLPLANALDCNADPCARSGRVFVVDYPRGTRDWQNRLPYELEWRGYREQEVLFDDLVIHEYRVEPPNGQRPGVTPDSGTRADLNFGPLRLESVLIEQDAASDSAVAVALDWRLSDNTTEDFIASLILRDPVTGELVNQTDTGLLDARGAPTSAWRPGELIRTYHVIPLPPGTPPVDLSLLAQVYSNQDGDIRPVEAQGVTGEMLGPLVSLGSVMLAMPVGLPPAAYGWSGPVVPSDPFEAGPGMQLLEARFSPGPYRPGQIIRVRLTWRATADGLPDIRPSVELDTGAGGTVVNGDAPANGRHPTSYWQSGEIVREVRELRVPGEASGGAVLAIRNGGKHLVLGEVKTEGDAVIFEQPIMSTALGIEFGQSIILAGYDPPGESLPSGQELSLTLYWKSLSDSIGTSYTVFVHLVSGDGQIIAQHDSIPANGARPTDEWLKGEFIIDPHQLNWRETDYTGPATIAVGLYDPASGRRLVTADGSDQFLLPQTITINPAN